MKIGCFVAWANLFVNIFFTTSSLTALLYLLLQMALLGFFLPSYAAASASFEPTSVELHRDPGPFEGHSTD